MIIKVIQQVLKGILDDHFFVMGRDHDGDEGLILQHLFGRQLLLVAKRHVGKSAKEPKHCPQDRV